MHCTCYHFQRLSNYIRHKYWVLSHLLALMFSWQLVAQDMCPGLYRLLHGRRGRVVQQGEINSGEMVRVIMYTTFALKKTR